MAEFRLSSYGRASATPSPVNRMMSAFANDFREGVDINLGVGYVSEKTIPHQWIKDALTDVVADPVRHKAPFNYGGAAGSTNLVQSLRDFYVANHIGGFTRETLDARRIIVGLSGATSLLASIAQTLEPGIVLTTDPMYYIYCDLLQRAGFEIDTVPEDDDGIDPRKLRERIEKHGPSRDRIRFIYIVTVGNPTCTILSDERRAELVDIAAGMGVPLILDTAYEMLLHDPERTPPRSALLHDAAGVAFELGTLSKILAPSLRIGYMIGRDCPFMDAVVQNGFDIGFSAPLVLQEIASRVLDAHGPQQVAAVNRGYREKAQATRQWINRYLGPHLAHVTGGSAGFYYYLTFRSIETGERSLFFRSLAQPAGDSPRVIYIPGEFCVHPRGDMTSLGRRQLRISYGFESLPQIEKALRLMGAAADSVARGDGSA